MLCIVSMYIQVFVRISSDYRLIRIQKRKLFKPQIKLKRYLQVGGSEIRKRKIKKITGKKMIVKS